MKREFPSVWVVVPYYQRSAGLLSRAIRSALSQTSRPAGILVVDDGSAVPATEELRELTPGERALVRLIEQDNRGPAAARNRALDALPDSAELVAFLDSDDTWSREYLETALRILDQDYDLVLSNWTSFETDIDAYQWLGRFDRRKFKPSALPHVYDAGEQLAEMQIRTPLGRLSATVLRRSALKNIRFDAQFRHACEDRKFVLEIAKQGARAAFQSKPMCHAGRGYNLFSSVKWGTRPSLQVHIDRIRFCRDVGRMELNDSERRALEELRRNARRTFFLDWAAYARRQGPEIELLLKLASIDLKSFFIGPIAAARSYISNRS